MRSYALEVGCELVALDRIVKLRDVQDFGCCSCCCPRLNAGICGSNGRWQSPQLKHDKGELLMLHCKTH